MAIVHYLKITGTGVAVPLSSGSPAIAGYVSPAQLQAKWVQCVTPPSNALVVNFGGPGDSITAPTASPSTTGRGFPIPVGWAGQMLPPVSEVTDWYDLNNIFCAAASGDVLYILYGG